LKNQNKNQTNQKTKDNPAWDQHNKGNVENTEKQKNIGCGCGCGCDDQ